MHEGHGAERMPESGVFGPREDHMTDAQLPDAAQPLQFGSTHQFQDQTAWNGDEPVDRIGKEFESAVQGRQAVW